MPLRNKILIRKRLVIETNNDELKITAHSVSSRYRGLDNFLMNIIFAIIESCLFPKKQIVKWEL